MHEPRDRIASTSSHLKRRIRGRRSATAAALLLFALPLAPAARAQATASARGTLSSGGETTALDHISLGALQAGTVVVLVSDIELEPPCDVLSAMAIAEQNPFHGVLFTLDKQSLELLVEGGFNTLLIPGVAAYEGFGAIKSGLTLEQQADGSASGRLDTTAEVGEASYEIAVELSFPLDVPDPPIAPRTVVGTDSEPGRAFATFVDGVMAADFEAVKALATSQMRAQMDQVPPEEVTEALASLAEFLIPQTITITDTSIEGERAVLTAEGVTEACLGPEASTGTIELLLEDGAWKVASVRFEG